MDYFQFSWQKGIYLGMSPNHVFSILVLLSMSDYEDWEMQD